MNAPTTDMTKSIVASIATIPRAPKTTQITELLLPDRAYVLLRSVEHIIYKIYA